MKQYQATPLPVDYSQRAVRVTFPNNAPATYSAGDPVTFSLSSLLMTGPHDVQDTSLTIKDGNTVLAPSVPVTPSNSTQPYDDRGNASVSVTLPAGIAGDQVLTVYGNQTGIGQPEAYITLPGVKVDSTLNAPDQSATYGSAGSLTATVSGVNNPDGDVTFSEGATTLGTADVQSDGTATLALPEVTLDAGTHTITASFGHSTALNDSTTTFTLTVGKADTTVLADDASGDIGSTVLLPVIVTSSATAKPDGTVTVLDGANVVGSGALSGGQVTVSVDTTGLSVGDHTLTVSYGGADNFKSSTKDITLTLSKATTTVTADDQSATYGSAGSLTATVHGASDPGGDVTFSVGATTLGSADVQPDGTATLALAEVTLDAGTHTVTADFANSDKLTDSSTTFMLTVHKADTTVVASDVVAARGQHAQCSGNGHLTGDGQARWHREGSRRGQRRPGDGHARPAGAPRSPWTPPALNSGANTVTVSYLGADNFAASQKDITVTITVSKKKPATVTAPDVSVAYGQSVDLPITVHGSAGNPTGRVRVLYGTKSLGSALLQGGQTTVTIKAKALPPGAHALSLSYNGDSVYAKATGTTQVTVTKATPTITDEVRGGPIQVNQSGPKLYVKVSATGLNPSGTVTLLIGSHTVQGTLSGGHVSILLPKFTSAGPVDVTIEYSGNANVKAATAHDTLTVH